MLELKNLNLYCNLIFQLNCSMTINKKFKFWMSVNFHNNFRLVFWLLQSRGYCLNKSLVFNKIT